MERKELKETPSEERIQVEVVEEVKSIRKFDVDNNTFMKLGRKLR
jgi:hypothetical protein